MEKEEIPISLEHLGWVSFANRHKRKESEKYLRDNEQDLKILGTSLSVLYQAATCHRKCHGGGHILEAIVGRTYNLATAAYSLISIGFYDEAMVMIRSIGEIANIISLSTFNKEKMSEWLHADKRKRLREFSPVKIRDLLRDEGFLIMDDEWYSSLCEQYTHISAEIRPNYHEGLNRNTVGGVINEKSLNESLSQLTAIVGSVALFICKYYEYDDLLNELDNYIDELRTKIGTNEK